jgi:hypothetical protein
LHPDGHFGEIAVAIIGAAAMDVRLSGVGHSVDPRTGA